MFYFNTISIKDASPQLVEKAIRTFTVKRSSYLDFLITARERHEHKYFSGLESNGRFLLTRLRENGTNDKKIKHSSRGYNVPGIIIRFKKDFSCYQIRTNFLSTVLGCLWLCWAILWTKALFEHFELWLLISLLLIYVSFPALVYMEIRLTTRLISKAIKRTREDELFFGENS